MEVINSSDLYLSSVASRTSHAAKGHAAAATLAKTGPICPILIIYTTGPREGQLSARSVTWISSSVHQRGSWCSFQYCTLEANGCQQSLGVPTLQLPWSSIGFVQSQVSYPKSPISPHLAQLSCAATVHDKTYRFLNWNSTWRKTA